MKLDHYTVIDVETANANRSSICQIAVQEIYGDQIIFEACSLINPQEHFDDLNISIHHIEEAEVKNAPTMAQYWPKIKDHCLNTVIVAHNAIFDLSALSGSLRKYSIPLPPSFKYLCTLKLAERLLPGRRRSQNPALKALENPGSVGYSLKALCCYYSINMIRHHDAFSDTDACRRLLENLLQEGELLESDIGEYVNFNQAGFADYEGDGMSAHNEKSASDSFNSFKVHQEVRICLTGKFRLGRRDKVEKMLTDAGAVIQNSVGFDTDYLVTGNLKNLGAQLSAKEKKAEQVKAAGCDLKIINEMEMSTLLKVLSESSRT
ncbi:MAG: exonuclease domain-containing protein [Candidatus Bruticola sp.]